MPDRDADYPPLSFEEREAFAGWQWVADEYSLKTDLDVGVLNGTLLSSPPRTRSPSD